MSDVVAATRAAAERPVVGGVYNVGGGSQVSLSRAVELIAELAGRRLATEHLPHEDGDVKDTGADVTRAGQELGFEPSVAFEAGLREEFEWVLEANRALPPALA